MALNRKYANLPDLDSAPDIYETPELTDDNSTAPTTTARTEGEEDLYDIDDDTPGISRSRLRIDEARSHFLPSHVDANDVDFSDRVDGKRKSYKASSRRQRVLRDGTVEYGEMSDDDEDSLERKIARLQREVEEAKEEYAKRESAPDEATHGEADGDGKLQSLSQALIEISRPSGIGRPAATPKSPAGPEPDSQTTDLPGPDKATYTVTYAPGYEQSHALAKAASFDRRLLLLENGLGLASSIPEAGENGLPRAILPTLDAMDKQITTLSQASTSNLDAISRRVRTLAAEQDKLNDSRAKTKTLREEVGKHTGTPTGEDSEQDTKINALYAILPTIESLTPVLPPLLDRLRSLRAMHADAAAAKETLDTIEQQQVSMTEELKQWSEGLDKLEKSIGEGGEKMQGNVKTMEGWVKELEERMAKLG